MVQWILDHHHFIIYGMLLLTPMILFLRGFYHNCKRKRKLQTYKWDRSVFEGSLLYIIAVAFIIGIVVEGLSSFPDTVACMVENDWALRRFYVQAPSFFCQLPGTL